MFSHENFGGLFSLIPFCIFGTRKYYTIFKRIYIMGKEIVLIKNEEKMSRQEAVKMLRNIADKLEEGKITLSQGNKEVELIIPKRVEVEIKAEEEIKKRKTTKKLEIEIEWLVGGSDDATGSLEIK